MDSAMSSSNSPSSGTSIDATSPTGSDAKPPTDAQPQNVTDAARKPIYDFRAPMEIVHITTKSGTCYPVVAQFLLPESAYFTTAFKGNWTESDRREVTLEEEVTDDDFAFLLQWVYTGEIKEELPQPQAEKQSLTHTTKKLSWQQLVSLWLLGDYLIMPSFQNHVIDTMFFKIDQEKPELESVIIDARVWTHVLRGSPLPRFFLELLQLPVYLEKIDMQASLIPPDYLKEALGKLGRLFQHRVNDSKAATRSIRDYIALNGRLSEKHGGHLIDQMELSGEFGMESCEFYVPLP